MKAVFQPITSPLQLDRYFLKSLHFELKPGYDRTRVSSVDMAPPGLEIGVVSVEQSPENPTQWRFEVSLELPDTPESRFPYTVETTLVGFFTVSEHYPVEHAERLARINGPALLYSSAREIVASITGRSPYPKLLIPSVTFIQPGIDQTKIPEDQLKQLGSGGLKQLGPGEEKPNGKQKK
jgi:preprotein translocase subunit SecB